VLQSIAKQDNRIAEKSGLKDLKINQEDRFTPREEGLEAESGAATTCLDQVTEEFFTNINNFAEQRFKSLKHSIYNAYPRIMAGHCLLSDHF
jgi:hypothetical protein